MEFIFQGDVLAPVIKTGEQPRFPAGGPLERALLDEVTESQIWTGFRGVPATWRAVLEQVAAAVMGYRYGVGHSNGTWAIANGIRAQLMLRPRGWSRGRTDLLAPVMTCTPAYYGMLHGVEAELGRTPRLVFVDSRRDGTMDPSAARRRLDEHPERALGVVPTTLYGDYPAMAEFAAMANEHGILLHHDDAQGGAALNAAPRAATASVSAHGHAKTTPAGEAGLTVTDDPALAGRLRALSDCGFPPRRLDPVPHDPDQQPFLAGNMRLAEHPAALFLAQLLRSLHQRLQARENRRLLQEHLRVLKNPIFWNPPCDGIEHPPFYKLFLEATDAVEEELGITPAGLRLVLAALGMDTEPTFVPAHQDPIWADRSLGEFPAAERFYQRGLIVHTWHLRDPRFMSWFEAILDRLYRGTDALRSWLAHHPSDVPLVRWGPAGP